MADPLTQTIRLTQPQQGGDTGLWAGYLNNDLGYIDAAINQVATINIPDANTTLTADGSGADTARFASYSFTGTLSATRTITLPANQKIGWAINNTSGGQDLILQCGTGTNLSLPPGFWTFFFADGTNVISPGVSFGVSVLQASDAGVAVNGPLAVQGILSTSVQAEIGAWLSTSGAFALSVSGWELNVDGTEAITNISRSVGIQVNGGAVVAITFDAISDVRVKSDIREITEEDGEKFVMLARPVTYIKEGRHFESGFIAQDMIRAGYDHMVNSTKREGLPELNENGVRSLPDIALSLGYDQTIAYLTACCQSLLSRVEALEEKCAG